MRSLFRRTGIAHDQTRARDLGRDGKLYLFDVLARDDAGLIGRGRHKRAVVDAHRLEESAAQRRGSE